jgi:HTH-type transcriptional regulator / antitoxin HigA
MAQQVPLFDSNPLHPGVYLREILDKKGATQEELAAIAGLGRQQINEIIAGKRGITPETAIALAMALPPTTPAFWMKVDSDFRLSQVATDANAIRRAAYIFELAPIKKMQRRGWIKDTNEIQEIEIELKRFFGTESLDVPLEFPVAMRRGNPLSELSPIQRAWCFRARQIASSLICPAKFDASKIPALKKELRQLAAFAGSADKVAKIIADFGIRFIVIEPLAGGRIDGTAFWLDENSPVIAISLRFDRFDAFWFTLMHECAHIEYRDGLSVDSDLVGDAESPPLLKTEIELRADSSAAASLVPPGELESFIRRVGPTYSKQRIIQFAHRIKIHPLIIMGQLQHRGELSYGSHRDLHVKVKDKVIQTALTDGWGQTIAPGVI